MGVQAKSSLPNFMLINAQKKWCRIYFETIFTQKLLVIFTNNYNKNKYWIKHDILRKHFLINKLQWSLFNRQLRKIFFYSVGQQCIYWCSNCFWDSATLLMWVTPFQTLDTLPRTPFPIILCPDSSALTNCSHVSLITSSVTHYKNDTHTVLHRWWLIISLLCFLAFVLWSWTLSVFLIVSCLPWPLAVYWITLLDLPWILLFCWCLTLPVWLRS